MVSSEPLKILLMGKSAEIGGTEKQILGLARQLSKENLVTVAFLNATGKNLLNFKKEQIDIKSLYIRDSKDYFLIFFRLFTFRRFLKKENFDIIHSFLPESVIFGYLGTICLPQKILRVAGMRGEILNRNKVILKLYSFILKKYDLIICNSHSLKNYCIEKYGIKLNQITTIHNGLKLQNLRKFNADGQIAIVSNFRKYKGYDFLMDSLNFVNSPCEFVFIGQGPDKQHIVKRTKYFENKHSFEFLEIENIDSILESCIFAIHPSESEGLSNAIMEELSFGLPVIAFDIGGNGELIKEMKNGILLPERNQLDLARAIDFLKSDRINRIQMSEYAIASVQKFSWEKLLSEHLKIYHSFLK